MAGSRSASELPVGERRQTVSDEKLKDRTAKFRKKITDPEIRPYLNKSKLAHSGPFRVLLDESIDHYLLHGDNGHLLCLLELFKRTKFYKPLLEYICRKSQSEYVVAKDGSISIRRRRQGDSNELARNEFLSLEELLSDEPVPISV